MAYVVMASYMPFSGFKLKGHVHVCVFVCVRPCMLEINEVDGVSKTAIIITTDHTPLALKPCGNGNLVLKMQQAKDK